ncbi:MAG: glycosyltransferase family 4 protein [Gemmatimonadota bacterium]|nr:glycosyltransferase family 4 protein [Gemmatimonadota bacterium]
MRILVVNWLDRENPRAGGAEIHLHETFGRLASRGHAVTALVSGWPGCATRTELDGLDVHRTGTRLSFSVAAPRYFRRELRQRAFDVVVEDLNKVPVFTPWWGAGVPTALLVHHLFGATAFEAASAPVALATVLLESAVPRAYRDVPVIAVSDGTRDDLVGRGLDESRITVVHNGIDLERFEPASPEERFEEPTLVFVGRLNRYKRLDLVLRAVRAMADRGLRARLLVAGAGDERNVLERLAERLGISERVTFLGFVSEERKVDILRKSRVHVLTSAKEGWGITNIEAAACGTPTVASDAPGLRESVVAGRTGVLVPHGDVDALTSALISLTTEDDRWSRMSEEARAFANGFSWEATADGVERVLERVVAPTVAG